MAKGDDSQSFRAKTDLYMPSGFPMAHTAGSVFLSSANQVEAMGWKDDVETVKPADVPAAVAPSPAEGSPRET